MREERIEQNRSSPKGFADLSRSGHATATRRKAVCRERAREEEGGAFSSVRTETTVLLTDANTGVAHDALLIYDLTHDEIDFASVLWSSAKLREGIVPSVEHAHWDWSRKARTVQGLSNYRFSGVDASGEMQGLVLWDEIFSKAKHPNRRTSLCGCRVIADPGGNRKERRA